MRPPIFSPVTLRKPKCIPVGNDVLIENRSFLSDFIHPLRSGVLLWCVHVFIAFSLGKYGAIDRSANPKRKLQLAVF
jgi:hypothetical protein